MLPAVGLACNPVKPEVEPYNLIVPLLPIANLVTPLEEAAKISPELVWFTIAAALLPMPPETESGAGVFADDPIKTPESKSDERTVLPEPFGVIFTLLFVPPVIVNVPLSAIWWEESVCVEPLIERPLIVLLVAAEMIPARERLPELVRALLLEKKLILPVFASPSCKVCLLLVARIPLPESDVALLPELAEIEAVGVPPATFSKANLAELEDVPPSSRSSVTLNGASAPKLSCQYWVRTTPLLVTVPLHAMFPVALKIVHPVEPYPPAILTSPGLPHLPMR